MGTQHYSLRWNNHQSHVLSAFDALLQNESLVDCTLVCEDTSVRAHKVVLSACSPYFQKIFTDNPCKHPIIVLKDIRGWEVQCIVDFMYKGETSVPESQLTGLIKAAESLKVRGLTSTDQHLPPRPPPPGSRHSSPMPPQGVNGYHCRAGYSPSPARYPPTQQGPPRPSSVSHHDEPHNKLAHLAAAAASNNGPHSNQSSPISLTSHDADRHRASSPGQGSGPRRKQARPRRRSGDSTGNASLDLSKADSPPMGFRKSPAQFDDATPENLSMKRPSSSPAMNLVKTETLLEDGRTVISDNISDSSSDRDCKPPQQHPQQSQVDSFAALSREHLLHGNGLHHVREHEALQALNFMAAGGGLPAFPPGHPLAHPNGSPHLTPSSLSGLTGPGGARPTSTPTTPSNAFAGRGPKGQHSAPRGGPPRSWTNDELTKALKNVWNRQMTTSQASRIYGIPYNSLLMYVRGKYGKSLKLDKLKETTPAAKDNLNTIGNSRSTPKEKAAKGDGHKTHKSEKSPNGKKQSKKEKRLRLLSESQSLGFSPFDTALNPFGPYPGSDQMGGLLMVPPPPDSRIKELLQQMQSQQAALDHSERMKELEKQLGAEQAKLLLPFIEAHVAAEMMGQFSPEDDPSALAAAAAVAREMMSSDSRESSPFTVNTDGERRHSEDVDITSDIEVNDDDEEPMLTEEDERQSNSTEDLLAEKEREVQKMLLDATAKSNNSDLDKNENDKKSEAEARRLRAEEEAEKATDLSNMVKPLNVAIPKRGNEISA